MLPHWYQIAWIPLWAVVTAVCVVYFCIFARILTFFIREVRAWRIQREIDQMNERMEIDAELDAKLLAEERRKFLLVIGGSDSRSRWTH